MIKRIILLSILLITSPPLLFLPPIQSKYLTTHTFVVTILILAFLYYVLQIFRKEIRLYMVKPNLENVLLVVLLIGQALPIINSQNIPVFIVKYIKILVGYIVYFLILYTCREKKEKEILISKVIKLLIIGYSINATHQLLQFLAPSVFFKIASIFMPNNEFNVYLMHYNNGKLYNGNYFELIFPALLLSLTAPISYKSLPKSKIVTVLLLLLSFFLSFISNFRYRLISVIFAIVTYVFAFKNRLHKKKSLIFVFIVSLLLTMQIASIISIHRVQFNVFDRLFNRENIGFSTINWRITMFIEAVDIGKSNMLGIGLGSFYDNMRSDLKNYGRYTDNAKELAQISTEAGPHNLFLQTLSESGIVSFFTLIILVVHYFVRDLNILKSSSGYKPKKVIVIMYWILILDALVIPTNNLTFYILFFIFRGLLVENSCLLKLNKSKA